MVNLKWGGGEPATFAELLQLVPASALDSPRRSLVPLLDFWRRPDERLAELEEILGFNLGPITDVVFEYAVAARGGRGKSSFTDVMVKGPAAAVAIEAKYTEPAYESVRGWVKDPAEPNRIAVLSGWLELINRACGIRLTAEQVLDVPYQLIHRSASVCSIDVARRLVLYLLFEDADKSKYNTGIPAFSRLLLESTSVEFAIITCKVRKTPMLASLQEEWNNGVRRMGHQVKNALATGQLYEFSPPLLVTG